MALRPLDQGEFQWGCQYIWCMHLWLREHVTGLITPPPACRHTAAVFCETVMQHV